MNRDDLKSSGPQISVDEEAVQALIDARIAARNGKDWAESDRIRALVARAGLPVSGPASLPAERYLELMAVDKKAARGKTRFILLDRLGSAVLRGDIPEAQVRATLAHCTDA